MDQGKFHTIQVMYLHLARWQKLPLQLFITWYHSIWD